MTQAPAHVDEMLRLQAKPLALALAESSCH